MTHDASAWGGGEMASGSLGRAAQLTPDAHRLYRALIDQVVASGEAPTTVALARETGFPEERVTEVLAEVIQCEWAGRDADGQLTALYPFATRPTGVRVQLG